MCIRDRVIRDSFKRILSFSTDKIDGEYVANGKYPPSFRVKVPVYDNRVNIDIVDASRNPLKYVTPDSLATSVFPKGVEANLVISGSIYNVNGTFGVTWRLMMAQVFPPSRRTAIDVFEDESSATGYDDEEAPQTQSQVVEDDSYPSAQVEEASLPLETPKPTARQRRVAKAPAPEQ